MKKGQKISPREVKIGCIVLLFGLVFLIGRSCSNDPIASKDDDPALVPKTDSNEETETLETKKSAGYYVIVSDVKTLQKRFNSFAKEFGSSLRVQDTSIEIGEVNNVFQYAFNERIVHPFLSIKQER